MAKKKQEIQEELTQEERVQEEVQGQEEGAQKTTETKRQLRYVGKTINHFKHDGVLYQLIPNTVYVDLPDCEQVRFLIENKELMEV